MEGTSVHRLLALISLLSRSTDQGYNLILDENSSDGGTVRRNTTLETRTECEGWGVPVGSSCNMTYLLQRDSGLYWCESMSGSSSSSSSIQLSVSGGSVILQSPVLPVMEGDDVTLSCRAKSPAHNLPAAFYKDGSFIGDGPSGHMTLLHVSSSDEGLYKCSISGQGESPSSRISVEEKPSTIFPSSAEAPPTSEIPPITEALSNCVTPPSFSSPLLIVTLLCHLVVMFLFSICSFLLGFSSGLRAKGSDLSPRGKMTPPPQDDDDVTTEHHF
ncbi:Fc receptor-like A isoform X2 [Poecilia latipinna]|uniref:Fc receptor-like A isoform X2 n=1 Tax=Poecilia latipinna TaxID=48699 RepID=UPI00072E8E31|nr:PREDICTED: Fc receptor-like A isoform X2 [Poecilia latipinna]